MRGVAGKEIMTVKIYQGKRQKGRKLTGIAEK
jgi:hypothetical protein